MNNETLRKVQLIQLEIAKEVKRICEDNNIQYFMDSGTLLGAVRHKGFIPWDDDLDIGMLRANYEKFLDIAPKKLNEKYELVDWRHNKFYPHPMAKVIKKGTIFLEEKRKDSEKQGIWVDIFSYDAVPLKPADIRNQRNSIMINRALIRAKCNYQTWYSQGHFIFTKWIKNLPIRVLSIFFTKKALVDSYEFNAKKYNGINAEFFFESGSSKYGKWSIPASCFKKYVKLQFEDTLFWAPFDYDLYLKTAYGNYMQLPPEKQRENRHSISEIDLGDADAE